MTRRCRLWPLRCDCASLSKLGSSFLQHRRSSIEGPIKSKQRAQEVAARLLINSAGATAAAIGEVPNDKRPKFENSASGFDSHDSGFNSIPPNVKPHTMSSAPLPSVSYGYQNASSSKKIDIPNGRVGVIIGKGGETIKYLQIQFGAKIQVTRDMDVDPNSPPRMVELMAMGTSEQIAKAEELITDVHCIYPSDTSTKRTLQIDGTSC